MSGIQPGQEGGYTAPDGTSWYHAPWEGWQRVNEGRPWLRVRIQDGVQEVAHAVLGTVDLGEPEAVITKLGWFLWDVNIHHGLTTFREGWTCVGRRWAESKARRELRRYNRPAQPTYTITS